MTNATDPSGLWEVKRSGKAWAEAISEDGDTVRTLARKVHLEEDEWLKWLKAGGLDPRPYSLDAPLRAGCRYKVPNTFVVYTSQKSGMDYWNPFSRVVGSGNMMRKMAIETGRHIAKEHGVNVIYMLEQSNPNVFRSLWRTDGIWGVAWGGHGAIYEGKWYGYQNTSTATTAPAEVRPPYKLGLLAAFHCGSADSVSGYGQPDSWDKLKSKNGLFIGYSGLVWVCWNLNEANVTIPPVADGK